MTADLVPVISTAGAVPQFGVKNEGPGAAGASVMSIGCVPVNFAATGHCQLDLSNDPRVDPGDNKVNVPALAKGETKWFGLPNVPGAAPARSWSEGRKQQRDLEPAHLEQAVNGGPGRGASAPARVRSPSAFWCTIPPS